MYEYETTSTFGGLIRSFNVTTNQWSGKYIFKRLKFLRSKFLSHLFTLIYLALWHGWKSGYYVTFTIELLIMKMEWEVSQRCVRLRRTSCPSDYPPSVRSCPAASSPVRMRTRLLAQSSPPSLSYLHITHSFSESSAVPLPCSCVRLSPCNVLLTDGQNGHSFL